MKEKAVEFFKNGYSCSESVAKACIEEGLCDATILPCATAFSGGMSSGCLCGAVASAQMVLGFNFGRENSQGNDVIARQKAKELVTEFKKKYKVTCCKVLSGGLEGVQRKERCALYVSSICEIIEELVKIKAANV